MSKWTDFVKQHYVEMKKTMKNVKLGDAMKKAAKAWKNRGATTKTATGKRKNMRKKMRKTMRKRRWGDCAASQQPAQVPQVTA